MANTLTKLELVKIILEKMKLNIFLLFIFTSLVFIYLNGINKFIVISIESIFNNLILLLVLFFVLKPDIINKKSLNDITSYRKKKVIIGINIIYLFTTIVIFLLLNIEGLYKVVVSVLLISILIDYKLKNYKN